MGKKKKLAKLRDKYLGKKKEKRSKKKVKKAKKKDKSRKKEKKERKKQEKEERKKQKEEKKRLKKEKKEAKRKEQRPGYQLSNIGIPLKQVNADVAAAPMMGGGGGFMGMTMPMGGGGMGMGMPMGGGGMGMPMGGGMGMPFGMSHVPFKRIPPIVDTSNIELEAGEILMSRDTRISLQYFMALFTFVVMLVAIFDYCQIEKMNNLVKPFPLSIGGMANEMFSNRTSSARRTTMTEDREKEALMQQEQVEPWAAKQIQYYIAFAICYGLFNLLKLRTMLSAIESETESAMGNHGSSGTIFFIALLSTLMVAGILGVNYLIGQMNSKLIKSIDDSFERSMKYYALSYPEKLEIDLIQVRYQCCGADNYKDYFEYGVSGRKGDPAYLVLQMMETNRTFDKYTSKLMDTTQDMTFYKTNDVPVSCCDPTVLDQCRTLNVDNSLGFYYPLNIASGNHKEKYRLSIFPDGCVTKMKQILELISLQIEVSLFLRAVLECLAGIVLRLIRSSYSSSYEYGQRPSIANIPTLLIIVYGAGLGLYYTFALGFYKFGDSFTDVQPVEYDEKVTENKPNN